MESECIPHIMDIMTAYFMFLFSSVVPNMVMGEGKYLKGVLLTYKI